MRTLFLLSTAATAIGSALIAQPVRAETSVTVSPASEVDPVVVLGTRSRRLASNVPGTVSVIDAEQIETLLATDIKDLIRFEPGVSVPTSPARFSLALSGAGRDANSGFTIRGMGGDRVLIINDGVRLPAGFSFGAQAVGRGGYNDLDLVKSVEILRGPASALYGSDGIAGAVAFTTKDPSDFLVGDQTFDARGRVAYNSADEGWTEGVAFAGRSGSLSGLLAYTRRDAQETENKGSVAGVGATRTEPNPQDFSSNAYLGKLVWEVNPNHTLRLTYDHLDSEMDGDALSSRSATVLAVTAHDETQRDRVSTDWRFQDFAGLSDGSVSVYWQDATTRQYTFEDRATLADRVRDTTFDNTVYGFAAQGARVFGEGSAVQHRVTFGGDWSMTKQEGLRDGVTPPVGETFPIRAFPKTEFQLAGLFLQDEIELLDGALSIIPAVRYDWYDLSPKVDAQFPAAASGQSDDHISPKLGVVYWTGAHLGVFANYSLGFRAPSPMQVNNYFENPVFGYRSIPNPNLSPETSESVEAGFRLRDIDVASGKLRLNTTAFATHYDDFIDQVAVSGTGVPGVDPLVYQYVNLTEVDIRGLEARADLYWDNGFSLIGSAAYAEGEQTTDGRRTALGSLDPVKVVAGLNYAAPSGAWGGSATVTWSGKKDQTTYNLSCANACYLGDSFTLLDLTAYWNVTERTTLRAGAFNVFDETYGWWSDVRGLSATSTVKDAYTQPGRNFGVSLTLRL
ncbi:TonB-dependent hemoglobin/transferrin/lactoferrin family receptor [Brevundimonas vesicularis]|uniref:TonB-dependent hemoglobin/transferrin/lactoferrin family receptor n=1 Tax=Brevundimonas vesicularis TaxID=41276 RepID=A0A1Z3UBU0_BREVE|nr:TonB-dependent hemoglobin/transferrin/lactoferrin family receptor [Brevundimonas vesicularis]ASE40434.1 TonB-dependent hemoglobin/transferrin/lactoferrin family receptor [Brevundimonas vesicularis]MDX2334753.1 TonB-dependent hemoglobin/transferrin/lactoferrin family receptor [Brevundimonas vesicularis]